MLFILQSPGHRLHRHSGAANDRDHLADGPFLDEIVAPLHSEGHPHGQFRPVDFPRDCRLDFTSLLGKSDDVTDLEALDRELDGHAPDCSFGGRSGPWPKERLGDGKLGASPEPRAGHRGSARRSVAARPLARQRDDYAMRS
jgi:hypothetical protein